MNVIKKYILLFLFTFSLVQIPATSSIKALDNTYGVNYIAGASATVFSGATAYALWYVFFSDCPKAKKIRKQIPFLEGDDSYYKRTIIKGIILALTTTIVGNVTYTSVDNWCMAFDKNLENTKLLANGPAGELHPWYDETKTHEFAMENTGDAHNPVLEIPYLKEGTLTRASVVSKYTDPHKFNATIGHEIVQFRNVAKKLQDIEGSERSDSSYGFLGLNKLGLNQNFMNTVYHYMRGKKPAEVRAEYKNYLASLQGFINVGSVNHDHIFTHLINQTARLTGKGDVSSQGPQVFHLQPIVHVNFSSAAGVLKGIAPLLAPFTGIATSIIYGWYQQQQFKKIEEDEDDRAERKFNLQSHHTRSSIPEADAEDIRDEEAFRAALKEFAQQSELNAPKSVVKLSEKSPVVPKTEVPVVKQEALPQPSSQKIVVVPATSKA